MKRSCSDSDLEPATVKSNLEAGDASSGARKQLSGGLGDALTTFAAFILYLGPGLTVNFYVCTVGYYENESRMPAATSSAPPLQ